MCTVGGSERHFSDTHHRYFTPKQNSGCDSIPYVNASWAVGLCAANLRLRRAD
jgi:hypothetical protein